MQKNIFKERREQLLARIKESHPTVKRGLIVLVSGFELSERTGFVQESSFYYLSGIEEAGVFLVMDLTGKVTLYIPAFSDNRQKWVSSAITPDEAGAKACGVDEVKELGDSVHGYTLPLLFDADSVRHLTMLLGDEVAAAGTIFTLNAARPSAYVEQKIAYDRLADAAIKSATADISDIVAAMRRKKTKREVELIYKAIELTSVAQEGAACTITDGKKEYEIAAGVEYIFRENGGSTAFPSIVASGKNSVVLHATPSAKTMKAGELVVVDIGARYEHYCADLTRTFPVSGTFTKRQREIYNLVLEVQEFIAQIARPGMWLKNPKYPTESLHHRAVQFLDDHGGYGKYFVHGIGHYLGMDVHDVGSYETPLEEGDVITIEPGIYLPDEGFGIRIEDNYWILKDSAMCLSQDLPKDADTIEEMAQAELEFEDEE